MVRDEELCPVALIALLGCADEQGLPFSMASMAKSSRGEKVSFLLSCTISVVLHEVHLLSVLYSKLFVVYNMVV